MNAEDEGNLIIETILKHYPDVQAIYLFGSYGTADEWPDSDVDIALLLPPHRAKEAKSLAMSDLCHELIDLLNKEVDLINLRRVPTVLQKEIIASGRGIYHANEYSASEFEMLTLSYYQKLNEERAEIIRDALATGRIIA
jgi:predicted nucleotidyltransferase